MPGLQFWQRILLLFKQPSIYPETPYTKYMKPSRIHLYTFFQILFFLGVFLVQNFRAVAIIFPFTTLMCIPGRLFLLPKFFEGWELLLLDGDFEDIDDWMEKKEKSLIGDMDEESGPINKYFKDADVPPTSQDSSDSLNEA